MGCRATARGCVETKWSADVLVGATNRCSANAASAGVLDADAAACAPWTANGLANALADAAAVCVQCSADIVAATSTACIACRANNLRSYNV